MGKIAEITYLEEENVELFQSDFKIVADYLVQMRKHNDYKPFMNYMLGVIVSAYKEFECLIL